MTGNMTSTGRGGAGNIADASKSPKVQPQDLETPTLKTSVVTTGRGGSGNMAPNTDEKITRARQDVGPIERQPSSGATHVGRGGAANVATKEDSPVPVPGSEEGAHKKEQGLAAKAKELFKKA
ncbi:hypothetical protein F4780DRAFT_743178 [Xylariomycetidae sp. FL0641]|nr:hypothetical protein F4780DRAFT_767299 [Xylariomycetidae sp. FL0641]KAI0020177.1 hypothetical protein F4780DRAFT_743178 [Xylariomycetidae sp. FL0641]